MRTILAGVALLLLQDNGKIKELIQKLEDDSVEVREQAQKDLTRIGQEALPLLKEASKSEASAELKSRAGAAIREIELAVKAAKVYRDPRPITVKAEDAELRGVLEIIARQADVKIDASGVDGAAKVTIDLKDAPLFQALDELCRGRDDRTFEYKDEGVVRFQKDRHPSQPAAYPGPFRVRVKTMNLSRNTDFKNRTIALTLVFDNDYEKYLKPGRAGEVLLTKASDDTGAALEIKRSGVNEFQQFVGGARLQARVWAGGVGMQDLNAGYTLTGLNPGARKVTLHGTVRYTFPLETREVRFENPTGGESKEAGDTTIQTRRLGNNGLWTFTFRKTREGGDPMWAETVAQRLDLASLVAVDQDGAEWAGSFYPMNASFQVAGGENAPEPVVTYQTMFQRFTGKALKEIRFRFVDQTYVKTAPFKFTDLELP